MKKLKQEEFILLCKNKHNNFYEYELVVYKGNRETIIIVCPEHGQFKQKAQNHITGSGCHKCYHKNRRLTLQNFIERSNEKHNFRWNYEKSTYVNNHTLIEIICLEHGSFFQAPGSHLLGAICEKCSFKKRMLTQEEFIEKANIKHNNIWDYSETIYKGYRNKITIICKEHGKFEQLASNHLLGHGCPQCSHMISNSEIDWLNTFNIPNNYRNRFVFVGGKQFNIDGVDFKDKIAYEFYGDYYHGNPKIYSHNDFNKKLGKTFGELYQSTLEKENILKENGWKIISIWEGDWEEIKRKTVG